MGKLQQNVADAVCIISTNENHLGEIRPYWRTVRAHLMSQEAEIERLRDQIQFWHDSSDEVNSLWQTDKDRLAAANALLREALQETFSNIGFMALHKVDDGSIKSSADVARRIEAHLQGAGDEAASSPEFLCPCGSSLCNGKEDEA